MARWFVDRSPQRGIPSVSLRRLLPDARFVGGRDWEVSGCTSDSRRLDPGQVFVAVTTPEHDGHAFVGRALDRGAAGVVVERPCPEAGRLQVVVPDTRQALAKLCHALAGDPADQLQIVGVAGTYGKTVTGLFLRSIFEATGQRFGLVSTLNWSDGINLHPAGSSPPNPESLAVMLAAMVERGCVGGVIRVPDDSLQRRGVDGFLFDAAVVTGLGGLGAIEPDAVVIPRRARAARFFRMVASGGAAVVNADDPQAELLGAVNLDAHRVSFALDRPADVTAKIERLGASGSRFRLRGFDREATVDIRLEGSRNVVNALAAAAVAWSRGLATDAVVSGLEAVSRVPGRFEPVDFGHSLGFEVRIDRGRTPAQLRLVMGTLRELCTGQIHCVVGAEGLRERLLRLEVARVLEACADRVILTSDNPRTEDPDQILDDLLSGFRRPGRVRVEPDRCRAIELALDSARPGDGVLIAGKGRERFQILADRAIPFDDEAVAIHWLRKHCPAPRRFSA